MGVVGAPCNQGCHFSICLCAAFSPTHGAWLADRRCRHLPPSRERLINFPETWNAKKLIALAAVLATTQASAFWNNGYNNGWNNGYGNTATNGVFDGHGDAAGAGDFSMNFSGRGHTNVRGYGYGYGAGDGWGRGYNYSAPYWAYAPHGHAPAAPVAPETPAAE